MSHAVTNMATPLKGHWDPFRSSLLRQINISYAETELSKCEAQEILITNFDIKANFCMAHNWHQHCITSDYSNNSEDFTHQYGSLWWCKYQDMQNGRLWVTNGATEWSSRGNIMIYLVNMWRDAHAVLWHQDTVRTETSFSKSVINFSGFTHVY